MEREVEQRLQATDIVINSLQKSLDRHLEIYAANGKESARVAANLENLINKVNDFSRKMDERETKSDGQSNEFSTVKADVDWLKKFFWVIITSAVGSIIAAIINVVLTVSHK